MNTNKFARITYAINNLSMKRWSPRSYDPKPVEKDKIRSIMEAARWSPSAGNEQPWRFIIGFRNDETWEKILKTLDEGNKTWAKTVPVFLLCIGKATRGKRNSPYPHFQYDTGQAAAHLTFEATNLGLHVHQMAGFDAEMASIIFNIPSDHQPLTVIAIGYLADPSSLPPDLRERELAERQRKEFNDFIFSGTFGQTTDPFI